MFKNINQLRERDRYKIQSICNSIVDFDSDLEIYLFGSYARGANHEYSDIDLLVLLDRDLDLRECRKFLFELYEYISNGLNEIYDLDIKVYTKDKFNTSSRKLGFEQNIKKYMINVYPNLSKSIYDSNENYITLMYDKIPVAKLTKGFKLIKVLNLEKYSAIKNIDDFIEDRIPSKNRRDIESLLLKWKLNEYNIYDIALITRLINPMDKYWIKINEEDNLNNLLKTLLRNHKDYSPSGNNVKHYYRCNDSFGILKKRLSPVITDTESEVICYRLSKLFEVPCCPIKLVDNDWTFSEYVYDFSKEVLKHVRHDMLDYSGDLFKDLLETYPDLEEDIYKMVLFDFITRQDDRHRSNMAILYTDGTRKLYPLYDNGRSLFFEDTEEIINHAVQNIEIYTTSFGEIGTYYDCIKNISNPGNYINLNISEKEVRDCFYDLSLPKYKVDGCVEWIMSCIYILKNL